MDDPYNLSTTRSRESSVPTGAGPIGAGKVGGWILRSTRYVVGILPPSQTGRETPWTEYAVDLIMWAAVVAAAGALLYLGEAAFE
jgi:hypothetical protein